MTRHVPIAILLMLLPAAWAEVGPIEWAAPATIHASTFDVERDHHRIDVATDGQGTWFSVWSEKEPSIDTEWDICFGAVSTDNGRTWSERFIVAAPGGKFDRTVYSDGVWGVAFYGWDNGIPYGIHVVRSTDLVSWSEPIQVADVPAGYNSSMPEIEINAVGSTWIVSWSQALQGSPDSDVWFVRSTNAGLTWSPRGKMCAYFDNEAWIDLDPTVAGRKDGTWVCVWRTTNNLPGYDLGIDFDLVYTRSTDDGLTWSEPVPVDVEHSSHDQPTDEYVADAYEGFPTLSTDGNVFLLLYDGHEHIGYSASRNGLTWTPFVKVEGANAYEDLPATGDGHGNWFATFESLSDIWGAPLKLSAIGEGFHIEWGEVELLAHSDLYQLAYPRIATDCKGTWMLTYYARWTQSTRVVGAPMRTAGPLLAEDWINLKSASVGHTAAPTGVIHWRAME